MAEAEMRLLWDRVEDDPRHDRLRPPMEPLPSREQPCSVPGDAGAATRVALEIASISRIVELHPEAVRQRTSNAAENAPMLRTNAELGYQRELTMTAWARPV